MKSRALTITPISNLLEICDADVIAQYIFNGVTLACHTNNLGVDAETKGKGKRGPS